MATPQQLREETALIAAAGVAELESLIRGLPDKVVQEALLDALPGLIIKYAEAASVSAAEWYDENRSDLGVAGSFEAFLPELRDPGVESLLRWADAEAKSTLTELSLIEGSVFRRIVNGARDTVIQNVAQDPQGIGYQRYARLADAGCPFCRMLAGRGLVYRSETTATFGAHDNCQCSAVPAFADAPIPVRPYTPSSEHITAADRARVREWLRKNAA